MTVKGRGFGLTLTPTLSRQGRGGWAGAGVDLGVFGSSPFDPFGRLFGKLRGVQAQDDGATLGSPLTLSLSLEGERGRMGADWGDGLHADRAHE